MGLNIAKLAERSADAAAATMDAAAAAYAEALAAEPFGGEHVDRAAARLVECGKRTDRAIGVWERADSREKARRERAKLRARVDAAQARVNAKLAKRAERNRPENRPGRRFAPNAGRGR